jgi:hypothetical protein
MIWGTPQPSPYPGYPETLFAQGAPDAPASTTSCPSGASSCTGDLVTIYANHSAWQADQYGTQFAGTSGTPDGSTSIVVHDASMDGCFTATVPIALNVPATADYNHGGVGHCSSFPSVGDTVLIPVVYEVRKNDGSCSANGGYCEVIEAIALVKITVSNPPHAVQGYIVGVPASCSVYNSDGTTSTATNCDPQHIIQLPGQAPLPSGAPATSTPTATAALPTLAR